MNVQILINQKWFEENKKRFHYIDKFDELQMPQYQILFSAENSEHLVTDDGDIKINGTTENISFTVVDDKPSARSLINLAGVISKYFNRAKTAFEALQ